MISALQVLASFQSMDLLKGVLRPLAFKDINVIAIGRNWKSDMAYKGLFLGSRRATQQSSIGNTAFL